MKEKMRLLRDAKEHRKSIKIIYHGGEYEGTIREIIPIYTEEDRIEAFSLHEGIDNFLFISEISIEKKIYIFDVDEDQYDDSSEDEENDDLEYDDDEADYIEIEEEILKYLQQAIKDESPVGICYPSSENISTSIVIIPQQINGNEIKYKYLSDTSLTYKTDLIEIADQNAKVNFDPNGLNSKRKLFSNFISLDKTIKICYNAGDQAGTVREIKPVKVFPFHLQAICCASNIVKSFRFDSLVVVDENSKVSYDYKKSKDYRINEAIKNRNSLKLIHQLAKHHQQTVMEAIPIKITDESLVCSILGVKYIFHKSTITITDEPYKISFKANDFKPFLYDEEKERKKAESENFHKLPAEEQVKILLKMMK